jgi:hypothetical protein
MGQVAPSAGKLLDSQTYLVYPPGIPVFLTGAKNYPALHAINHLGLSVAFLSVDTLVTKMFS